MSVNLTSVIGRRRLVRVYRRNCYASTSVPAGCLSRKS